MQLSSLTLCPCFEAWDVTFFFFYFYCPSARAGLWEADQISVPWVFASAARSSHCLPLPPSGPAWKQWTEEMYSQG